MSFKTKFKKLLIFALGLGSGILLYPYINANEDASSPALRIMGDYQFVSPLLMCSSAEKMESEQYTSLEGKVEKDIAAFEEKNSTASVYFRELQAGQWFGINENQKYSPASLLKLPLAIAYYKYQENNPDVFSLSVVYQEVQNFNGLENFVPEKKIESGASYTIGELLNYMLVYSDNNALAVLDKIIASDLKEEVYSDLGVSLPTASTGTGDFMTVKDYAHFFRVLYNATYAGIGGSETLLQSLSKARFPQGLAAGIPENIPIAQKFGERKILDDPETGGTKYELHDCGIIYIPEKPYLLCVMTAGTENFEVLSEMIKTISTTVYKDMLEQQ